MKITKTFNPSKAARDIAKKAETIRALRSSVETTTNMLKKAEEEHWEMILNNQPSAYKEEAIDVAIKVFVNHYSDGTIFQRPVWEETLKSKVREWIKQRNYLYNWSSLEPGYLYLSINDKQGPPDEIRQPLYKKDQRVPCYKKGMERDDIIEKSKWNEDTGEYVYWLYDAMTWMGEEELSNHIKIRNTVM